MVKFNLSVPLYRDKIFAGLEYQYTSSREHHSYDHHGRDACRANEAAGYGVVNFTLFSQNLVKDLEFSASVYNLFDTTYYYPASRFHLQDTIEADGRAFRLKLTYRF